MPATIITITEETAGQRIDNFCVAKLKGVPKTRVYKAIRKGEVRVNGGRIKAMYKLKAGDSVRLPPIKGDENVPGEPPRLSDEHKANIESMVIFESNTLLVLNKPSGLAVHGGSGVSLGVIESLRAARPNAPYLELIHRLDRATSGCLLIAKRRSELRRMHEVIRERNIEKKYLCMVAGDWPHGEVICSAPLVTHSRHNGERHVTVEENGKPSETQFKPLDFYRGKATLLEATLMTGRTHQIRVHAQYLGHPIIGDERYGSETANYKFKTSLALHASMLGWDDPVTGEPRAFSAPLPKSFTKLIDSLERKPRVKKY